MSGQKPKRVAVAFPASVPWMARCLQEIAGHAREHGGWALITSPPNVPAAGETALDIFAFKDWPGDGVITVINNPAEARAARRLQIPVVNLGGALRRCWVPRVMVDHYAIGRLAAEHLLERGLRRLAFYGFHGPWYSQQRRQGFIDRAAEAGLTCEVFEPRPCPDAKTTWSRRTALMVEWLKRLPLPVGVFAVQDYRARALLDECLGLGLRVPHDVAVLGVDHDTTVCDFCQPTLSSVSPSPRETGRQAAALLDRLMAGGPAPEADIVVPPGGVVARRSTDTVFVENRRAREAVQYMHDHFSEPFTVGQVVNRMDLSRRLLEKQLRRHLGLSPHEYLTGLRIEHAKQLLGASEGTRIGEVTAACGFTDTRRFRVAFRRSTGMTPMQYRLMLRNQSEAERAR